MERQDLNGVRTPMDVQRRMKNKQVEENTKTINKIIKEQIQIDSALSSSSENPVQNKIITQKFNEYTETANLASVATSGDYTDLSNTPTIPDELADLTDDSTHRLVTDTEKTTWNGKQNALTTQTAYTSMGSSTKVPQITTNTLGQVTGITEVTITQPTKTSDLTNDSNFITEDSVSKLRHNNGSYSSNHNVYRYHLLLTKKDTRLIPVNMVEDSTGTSKTLTTEEFNPFGQILYCPETISTPDIDGSKLFQQARLDLRYSFNTGSTLTANKDVFIVCVPQTSGLVKLHSTPISQTLPTTEDGYVYIYLGRSYSTYQIELHVNHPVYQFKNGSLQQYIAYDDNIFTGTEKTKLSGIATGAEVNDVTDIQVNGTSVVSSKVANLVTNTAYDSSSNKIATMSDVPDELADLSDDSTHRLVTDTEKTTWNGKQDELVSGTNIKTINNTSILGSGDISIGGGGTATDVQVNGTSITSSNVANIQTEGTYNSSTNKISTMSDITGITGLLASLLTTDKTSLVNAVNEVRGLAINEYGINSNGHYIKFSNGVAICWNRKQGVFIGTTQAGSVYTGTFSLGSLPITFKDNGSPRVWCVQSGYGGRNV